MIDRRQGDDNWYKRLRDLLFYQQTSLFTSPSLRNWIKNNACTALALIKEQKQNRLN